MKRKDCFLYFRFPLLPMLIPFPMMTKVINLASFLNFQRGEMHWGNVPSVLKNCTKIALKLISKKARKQKVLLSTEIWLQTCRHCYVSNIYIAEYSWTSANHDVKATVTDSVVAEHAWYRAAGGCTVTWGFSLCTFSPTDTPGYCALSSYFQCSSAFHRNHTKQSAKVTFIQNSPNALHTKGK